MPGAPAPGTTAGSRQGAAPGGGPKRPGPKPACRSAPVGVRTPESPSLSALLPSRRLCAHPAYAGKPTSRLWFPGNAQLPVDTKNGFLDPVFPTIPTCPPPPPPYQSPGSGPRSTSNPSPFLSLRLDPRVQAPHPPFSPGLGQSGLGFALQSGTQESRPPPPSDPGVPAYRTSSLRPRCRKTSPLLPGDLAFGHLSLSSCYFSPLGTHRRNVGRQGRGVERRVYASGASWESPDSLKGLLWGPPVLPRAHRDTAAVGGVGGVRRHA